MRRESGWIDYGSRHAGPTEPLQAADRDIAGQLASLKGEADVWLRDPDYAAAQAVEIAHSAVEAATIEAEGQAERGMGAIRGLG